ncbi:MAG: hypothetical protein OCD76_23980, partial [Reichenbachiella sp.]
VSELTLGQLQVISYDKIREKVVIVPVNNATVPNATTISQELNRIYGPAVAEWEVVIASPYEAAAETITGLTEGESNVFSSFPKSMGDFNKDYKRSDGVNIDKNSYYLFLLPGTGDGRSGFMPFKRQFGYIWTGNTGRNAAQTIAHELGHGAFRLRHTFSTSGSAFVAGEGTTDNLMDYSDGDALYKHQWDFVHDPESMNGWVQEDEESALDAVTYFVDWRDEKIIIHSDMTDGDGNVTYVTPSGQPFILPLTTEPSFTGLIKDANGTKIDLNIPRGVLQAFKLGNETYAASYAFRNEAFYFKGYKKVGTEAEFKTITTPVRQNHKIILGQEDSDCHLQILSADYTYSLESNNEFNGEGSSISSLNYINPFWKEEDRIHLEDCFNDSWTWLLDVSLDEFDNTVFAKYNYYGQGGVLQKTASNIYLYSNIDDSGNHGYFQWAGNQWTSWIPPKAECTSCQLREMMTIWFAMGLIHETGHTTLDMGGLIPALGEPMDFINGIWYTVEGDATNATLSFASTVPIAGWVSTGGKYVLKGVKKAGKFVKEGSEFLIKYSDEIADLTNKVNDLGFTDELVDALNTDLKSTEGLYMTFLENPSLIDSWSILFKEGDEISAGLRKNPENLQKLNDYIVAEGVDLTKLKNTFKNTAYPEKWLELKIPQSKLDEIYDAADDPLSWTAQHKAKKWNNYKAGDRKLDFEPWSNNYDGNIKKSVKSSDVTKGYAEANGIDVPNGGYEFHHQKVNEVTLSDGTFITGNRRHDIFNRHSRKAIEVKDYRSQKVYKSKGIEKEALMDIELFKNNQIDDMDWVFLDKGPSDPLEKLLKTPVTRADGKVLILLKQ